MRKFSTHCPSRFHPPTVVLLLAVALLTVGSVAAFSQDQTPLSRNVKPPSGGPHAAVPPSPRLCAACIRGNMEFLASDAMRGRGSGTEDELLAATYVAAQLRAYGIAPAGNDGSYIQR